MTLKGKPANRIPFPAKTEIVSTSERLTEAELTEKRIEFSNRFKAIFRGLSNAQIARQCRTTDAVIKNYVEGNRFPTAELLLQIGRATGVNLNWLLTGQGQRRVEYGDLFSKDEEKRIEELAKRHGRSFQEEVRALTMGAVEFLGRI